MKVTIALSPETLQAIDEFGPGVAEAQSRESRRSLLIEQAILEFLEKRRKKRQRQRRDARDLEILNRRAEDLNREVEDVLTYQAEW